MFNLVKESLYLTNKYIVLSTPLIFFALLSSLYILFSIDRNLLGTIITLALCILMLAAFLSGWGHIIKIFVSEDECEEEDGEGVGGSYLLKDFPEGVGEFFLPVIGMFFVIFLLFLLLLACTYFIGMEFIGSPGISFAEFTQATESSAALQAFLMTLSKEQLFRISAWNFILSACMLFEYFLILFALPALFFKSKNPFKAFFLSLRNLFSKKFFKNLLFYILLYVMFFVISFFTSLSRINIVSHFIFTVINFYFVFYVTVLIMNYYYKNFVEIGGNLDKVV